MKRLIKDKFVFVVVAERGGWYTKHRDDKLVFLPELVELLLDSSYLKLTRKISPRGKICIETVTDYKGRRRLVSDLLHKQGFRLSEEDLSDAGSMVVEKVEINKLFAIGNTIDECGDSREFVVRFDDHCWFEA